MMTKTTLSDGRRTRPRFAAPTPTPPKFLIGTDDPARIGILPVLRREGSDQRESKGFGWDPAKTLRMAEPPKFLIGTIEQSENHSTSAKQTTYPNPNGHKTRFSPPPRRLADSPQQSRHPRISRPWSGLVPLVYPERRRAIPASRRAQLTREPRFAAADRSLQNLETAVRSRTACASSPAQGNVREGIPRLSRPDSAVGDPRSLNDRQTNSLPLALVHPPCLHSNQSFDSHPFRPAPRRANSPLVPPLPRNGGASSASLPLRLPAQRRARVRALRKRQKRRPEASGTIFQHSSLRS